MLKIILSLFLTSALATSQLPSGGAVSVPLSVCQVLENLSKYRSTRIEVRGEWTRFSRLKGNCGSQRLRTGNYDWPFELAIENPQNFSPKFEEPVDWEAPDPSIYRFTFAGASAELEKLVVPEVRKRAAIMVTMVGRLDVRFDQLQREQPAFDRKENLPDGYGGNGGIPARLVLVSFKDVTVTVDGKSLSDWELTGGIPKR